MVMKYEIFSGKTFYQTWVETQGLDVIRGYAVDDVNAIPLKPWARKGGTGAYINLIGAEDADDAYICEIPAGGALRPQKHLFEEFIYVLKGSGATEVWNEGQSKQKIDWQEGSLFAVPLNAWHQHFSRGERPARYIAVTNAPPIMDIFHNSEFIFNNPFVFSDRYNGERDYFIGKSKLYLDRYYVTNFVPNVNVFELIDYKERGVGSTNVKFNMAGGVLEAHVSQVPVGMYKKAHRHQPGAQVLILEGTGYTLMWKEGQPKEKFDWRTGSLLVPPRGWFHQHFNTGSNPAKYLALRWGSKQFLVGQVFDQSKLSKVSTRGGGNQIEYEDEDPKIKELYEEELRKRGLEIRSRKVG